MITMLLLFLAGLPAVLALVGGHCPPAGPVLPPPELSAGLNLSKLDSQLDNIVKGAFRSFNATENSFSILLTSRNATVYQYHHTAAVRDPSGVKKVDGDTVYRLCSVTKLFNVLTVLLNAGDLLDTSITKYVPELAGVQVYEGITLRMLSSQVSGLPRSGDAFDLATTDAKSWEDAGFPVPSKGDMPPCDVIGGEVCSRARMGATVQALPTFLLTLRTEFFENLKNNQLIWLPGAKTAYSNQAYTLLGMAMQNITGKTFAQLLQDSVTKPLDMPLTGFTTPDYSRGIIPNGAGKILWDQDMGNYNATAGLFSTPNELGKFVRGIMNHKLLSAANTRQWMRPASFAGSFSMSVGAPWEIFRVAHLTPDQRPIDIYTKSGSMPGWAAYLFFLPDYNVGGAIAVSGDDGDAASLALLDIVAATVVPAVDSLARGQAKAAYTGQYGASSGDNKRMSGAAHLELVIDQGPGLKVKSWFNKGKSIIKAIADHKGVKPQEMDLRLYPVGENNRWQLSVETLERRVDVARKPSDACLNWFQTDSMRWATLPVDEFDFEVTNGRVVAVRNLGLRANLSKID
ncbi:beta-lactamase, putative [Metarhizium acridum CQMa 102]|uniref:Beta-lactamase, putative n=1 Tax=Metarhizium acridum (strain CQMa 102) TaxID=655827 RepID=E9ECJ9_METAQ|nr:beta-lactamase, putative [Metarhizium acridum CQMa 102]EFY86376.1 beta-lactamase, putative [Metarhizium acridum CQMa 102]